MTKEDKRLSATTVANHVTRFLKEKGLDVDIGRDGIQLKKPYKYLSFKMGHRGGGQQLTVGGDTFLKFTEATLPDVCNVCFDIFSNFTDRYNAKLANLELFISTMKENGVNLIPIDTYRRKVQEDLVLHFLGGGLLASEEVKEHDGEELPDFVPFIRLDMDTIVAVIPQHVQHWFDGFTQELKCSRASFEVVSDKNPLIAAQKALMLNDDAFKILNDLTDKVNEQRRIQKASRDLAEKVQKDYPNLSGVQLVHTDKEDQLRVRVSFQLDATEGAARELMDALVKIHEHFPTVDAAYSYFTR